MGLGVKCVPMITPGCALVKMICLPDKDELEGFCEQKHGNVRDADTKLWKNLEHVLGVRTFMRYGEKREVLDCVFGSYARGQYPGLMIAKPNRRLRDGGSAFSAWRRLACWLTFVIF